MNAATAIDECTAAEAPATLQGFAGRTTPLVIRGLCRDWPLVHQALTSDTAFARYLAAHDSGAADASLYPRPAGARPAAGREGRC